MKNDKVIPQVNQGVTDRNREQTEQILRLRGYEYISKPPWVKSWRNEVGDTWFGDNTYGSFTLCQVVWMLEAAIAADKKGEKVVVVAHSQHYAQMLKDRLNEMDDQNKVRTISVSHPLFRWLPRVEVMGWPGPIFVDHYAYETSFLK